MEVRPFMATIIKSSKKASGKGFVTNPHTVQLSRSYAHFLQVPSSEHAPLFYRVNEVNTGFSNQTPLFLFSSHRPKLMLM